jgi:CheY-like chemotaxis protein
VLVVEDDELTQRLLTSVLSNAGYTTVKALNGTAALAAIRDQSRTFDLVLLDMQLPDMSGLVIAKGLRQARGEQLPILALTGNAECEDLSAALAAGCNAYLTKPMVVRDLLAVARDLTAPVGTAMGSGNVRD